MNKGKLGIRSWSLGVVGLGLAGASAAGLLAACSGSGAQNSEGALGMAQDAVQIAWVGITESSTTDGVNLIRESSQTRKGKATAAIRAVRGAVNASCGSTFISNRRALTAAHCVDNYAAGQTFTVEQYNTTNLNLSQAVNQSTVTGSWPSYARPVKLSNSDGYFVTSYSCTVERRCSLNPLNCPAGAVSSDIAMVYCSSRSLAWQAVKNWVPVAASDPIGATVDVWWFHELLNLDTSFVPYTEPYSPDFNWYYYGHYDGPGTEGQNFHYTQTAAERLQLLPLRSTHSKQNVPYTSTGTFSVTTSTNIPVCHGTSGSGVFRRDTDELLGVADTASLHAGGESAVLCSDMNAVIGSSSMQYSSRQFTAVFNTLPEVTSERN